MKGYEDWSNLVYDFRADSGVFADGVHTAPGAVREISFDVVVDLRVAQVNTIVEAINTLPASAFTTDKTISPNPRKEMRDEMFVVEDLIKQDLLEDALTQLEGVRAKTDGSDDVDDLIVDPAAQTLILELIDVLIESLVIALTPANLPPVAIDDDAITPEGTPVIIPVLDNDGDPENNPLTIISTTVPTNGLLLFTATEITYTPNPGFVGADSFDYTISDSGAVLTEGSGTDTATVSILVEDIVPPILIIPADVTAQATGVQTTVNIGIATATDIVDPAPIITNDAPAGFSIGQTLVTWTATDVAGNSASAVQTVSVVDTTPPEITAPPAITVEATSQTNNIVEIGVALAFDLVGVTSITNDAPALFSIGQTIITWTATDAAGNSASATQIITVVDTTDPTLSIPPNVTLEAPADTTPAITGTATATDTADSNPAVTFSDVSVPGTGQIIETIARTWTATDSSGNSKSDTQIITLADTIAPTFDAIADLFVTGPEGTIVNFEILASDDVDPSPLVTCTPASGSEFSLGETTVECTATDSSGNFVQTSFTVTVTDGIPPLNIPPIADANGPYLTEVATPVNLEASASSDPDVGDTLSFGWSTTSSCTFDDASLANPQITCLATGIFDVTLEVTDSFGESDIAESLVVVYDPSGGFVTGGGWFDSPAGAYIAGETLTGKVNFGFVSKYKKAAAIPTGVTQFQFKTGNLNFHSDSYEFLVIAGAKAIYKGVGTINGEGNFNFMLSVIDADVNDNDSHEVDKFRIKIFDDNGIVYDNKVGETDDNADPTTEISGGSIKIHKAK